MRSIHIRSAALCILITCIGSQLAFGAEVFYVGQGASGDTDVPKNQSFSWQKRIGDLVDFANYGNYGDDRSGMITGSVMEDVSWNDVGGNGEKSFLRKGVYQNTEVNVNAYERLYEDYNFEGQAFIRRTDDRRIERRKDIRLKQLTTKIYNPKNMLLFGDFYGDFSQFVLGTSLEGFYGEFKQSDVVQFKGVAARSQSPDPDAGTYWRNVAGGKIDHFLFRGSEIFSNFRTGLQVVASQDDRGTVDNTNRQTPIPDLHNVVGSIDGEIDFMKYLSLVYELAGSSFTADQKANSDVNYGIAFRCQPRLRLGPLAVKYLYYYVQPQFYTDAGSAMQDKIQHQFTVDYDITRNIRFNFVENYYWDHLKRSSRGYRTTNDEQYCTLTLRPFEKHPDFSVRAYTNVQQRNSDDPNHTVNNITLTPGIAVNDNLDEKTSYGMFYEFRGYVDRFDRKNSDFFYRLGGNIGREQQVFGRRLYLTTSLNMDFHDLKTEDDDDVTTGMTFSGQYNFLADHMCYFGYNINTSEAAGPAQGYFNTMSYLEMNLMMEQKRNARLIFRGEFNRYNQEDSSQSYDETRIITKFLSNF